MSILIRGMDIPAHCGKCPIETNECRLWENFGDRWERRHPDCPLVEAKTPHGRLIDADKLNIYDVSPVYGFCVMGVTEEDIGLADPVIEAEG